MTNIDTIINTQIWGPHYWFVLHTIALTYPSYPNDVVKRKYYDFIQTLPLLIPETNSSKTIQQYIDEFSVVPYLDSKKSFITYINRMHNHINVLLGKDVFQSMEDSTAEYFRLYNIELHELQKKNKKYKKLLMYIITPLVCFIILLLLYIYTTTV